MSNAVFFSRKLLYKYFSFNMTSVFTINNQTHLLLLLFFHSLEMIEVQEKRLLSVLENFLKSIRPADK